MSEDKNLERLIDYVNRKNRETDIIITPREVMEYYREQKLTEPQKAFIRTLRYIDDKVREYGL